MSKHCPASATCPKRARSSFETISGRYAGTWSMNTYSVVMISLNNTQSAARKKHLFASISYGAPLLRIYVTLLTRKTKPSRYLALEPSRGVLKILRWSLSSQARKLSTLSMLSLAPRHRRQRLAVPNGNELRRPPTCPLKKLLNFSYWLFSCWP